MQPPIHQTAARGFPRAAEAYQLARPEYAPEAVEFLVEGLDVARATLLLDLGAGTGKLTRMLLPAGAEVMAVEPIPEMREQLARLLPQVEVRAGTAEAIPLPDQSADLVVAGSAFHWFEPEAALAEIHRVLVPDGGLALLWNVRDRSVEWIAALYEVIDPYRGVTPGYRSPAWRRALAETELFTEPGERRFGHQQEVTPETVVAQVASISFIAALPDDEREGVLAEVKRVLAHHPQTRDRSRLLMPYRTVVHWCRKVG